MLYLGSVQAQDRDTEARLHYLKAEELLNEDKIVESLDRLTKAEESLGSTNKKILFLKIQAYDRLIKKDWSYAPRLKSSLSEFFSGDMSSVSKEKQYDISVISVNFKETFSEYESEYQSLKSVKNYGKFKRFLTRFPNSDYGKQLALIYSSEIEAEAAAEKRESRKLQILNITDKYSNQIKKSKTKAIVFLALGITFTTAVAIIDMPPPEEPLFWAFISPSLVFNGLGIGYTASWISLGVKKRKEIQNLQVGLPSYNLDTGHFQMGFRYRF